MCMIFGVEDLVASAFIGLFERNGSGAKRRISVRQLAEYKYNVLISLNKAKKAAVIPISRDYMDRFFYMFDDYFSYEEHEDSVNYICLNDGKTEDDLKNKFRVYIPSKVRNYFEDEQNLKPILSGTAG